MKFWEALEAMERGATCECSGRPGRMFKSVHGEVMYRDGDDGGWEHSSFSGRFAFVDDWRIVTPAPVDTKQDFEASGRAILGHRDFVMPAPSKVEQVEPAQGVQRGPIDVYARGDQGFSRTEAPGAHQRITKLQKRVKALERRADNMREWVSKHGVDIAVLEAMVSEIKGRLLKLEDS